ncbi:unnamed protein product [Cylindrotheca closterium]|uniref:Uncharacterized protein n=1 Tax=Cylindrotheca closterium TaxID=2856 RepID=A0AAD2CYS3_9STRA|nr:unnamed protein product [Cylindrotheca closterium]
MIGSHAFNGCKALVEANLSTSSVKEIPMFCFEDCGSLQTVSLPHSLEHICTGAFNNCICLVTVLLTLDSKPVWIGPGSFCRCSALANLVLPQRSCAADEYSFDGCAMLQDRFGGGEDDIVAALISRFDNHPVHKLCYYPSTTAQELQQCIEENEESLKDGFEMTPFHVLLSTIWPSQDLLRVLLDKFPCHLLGWKDANDKRPLDYLLTNWTTETSAPLLQTALQSWMVDRLAHWGATSWMETMHNKVQAMIVAHDKEQRATLYTELYSDFALYQKLEITCIVEMALWKGKIDHECINDGPERQFMDREEFRYICGSDVVIPNVVKFLHTICESC